MKDELGRPEDLRTRRPAGTRRIHLLDGTARRIWNHHHRKADRTYEGGR